MSPLDEEARNEVNRMVIQAAEKFKAVADQAAAEAVGEIGRKVEGLTVKVGEIAERPAGEGGLSEADVQRLAAESVQTALAARDEQAAEEAKATAAKAAATRAREAFVAEHAAKIPEAYRAHIPDSADGEQLQAGLDKAVAAMKADAEAYGWKLPDLGASAGGEGGEPPKTTKTPRELMAMTPADRDAYLKSEQS